MMTFSNGNIFRVSGPSCGEFIGHRWIPLTKATDAGLKFSLISAWTNGWVNNEDAGDSRHHRAHYDVTIMSCPFIIAGNMYMGCCFISTFHMMTSSNGNIFRVNGHLCGVPVEFTAQRPVTQSFDIFLDLRLNKRLSKQSWYWWFETPLWRHCNETWLRCSLWGGWDIIP